MIFSLGQTKLSVERGSIVLTSLKTLKTAERKKL